MRKVLQRAGVIGETTEALPSDSREVRELLADAGLAQQVRRLADEVGMEAGEAQALAAGYLRSMAAAQTDRAGEAWRGFASWMTRAHDFLYDEEAARRIRALDRKHSLFFLFSHRSYLDVELSVTLHSSGIDPAYVMGGANLDFFPFGAMARKVGMVFIRRDTADLPIYRLILRSYIGQLTRNHKNIAWSIEGGRSRTGKLRPPAYGILRYVVDAIEAAQDGPEALIIPVSFVYEQLHEVGTMTSEARGGKKRPEDLRWLVNFARSQGDRLGHAYLDFGEPLPVRQRLAELRGEDPSGEHLVERLALDACHRINQATPVTATAVVCVALLGVDRALTLDEVLDTVRPLAQYIARRKWPVAGAANLTDRATIRRTMQDLVHSSVLVSYDGGLETVWRVGAQQHLIAAFYRNTAIHILVDRAIGELALLAATEATGDAARTAGVESLRLRDLLKFDFFFPSRAEFIESMRTELELLDPAGAEQLEDFDADQARAWLAAGNPLISHLVLRPFLDAYNVVADRLADWEDSEFEDFEEQRFLDECLRVGRQWALQRKVASEESVSLELFKPALKLADHRGLVAPGLAAAKGREDFAIELRETVRRVNEVAAIAHTGETV
ncbi:lysophospholipid acyltransferase [Leekyejoonella antrihumi]|uniref:Lysophospholipid acyltransferase n=2 Tax=Leekyejoonella antrihumi TaxID=1660198 RepID=A0A563DZE0_9MICO|nr:lysophospholipid acyltransferase [Leekyejoonella antrihumi]